MKYPFTVSIDEAISGLIYRLISAEANQSTSIIFNINWQYRLMSSMSTLREICLYKTFEEEKIKDNEILVIMSPETIKFSLGNKIAQRNSIIGQAEVANNLTLRFIQHSITHR